MSIQSQSFWYHTDTPDHNSEAEILLSWKQCGWTHQKYDVYLGYMMMVMFSDPLALSRTFQELQAHVAEPLPWAGLLRRSSCGTCFSALLNCESLGMLPREADSEVATAGEVRLAAPHWEPGASSIQLLRSSSTCSPVWGHGEAWPIPFIWSDEYDDDNLRWSEKLHRRQRCSSNGDISDVIRSEVTEKSSTEKALWKANTFKFLLETHRQLFRSESKRAPPSWLEFLHFGAILLK